MIDLHQREGKPAQFLIETVGSLPRGRVLDIAMGSGRNAIYLASLGFEVEGVDISPEAIKDSIEAARSVGVNVKARVADLEADYVIDSFDSLPRILDMNSSKLI